MFVGETGLSLSIWEGLQHPPVSEGPCRTLGAKSRGWWCYSARNFLGIGPCALCITPRGGVRSAESPLGLTGQTGSCVGACPCWLLLPASDSSKAALPLFVLGKTQSPLFPYKKPCYRGNGFVSLWQPRGGWMRGGRCLGGHRVCTSCPGLLHAQPCGSRALLSALGQRRFPTRPLCLSPIPNSPLPPEDCPEPCQPC